MSVVDCHTHSAAPQPRAVVCVSPAGFDPMPGQLYSVGIHPWDPGEATEENFSRLEAAATLPQVVAVGEAGIDSLRGGPMFRQMLAFRRQIEISEKACKPLVIHDVRAHDTVAGLRRDYSPRQPWIIHGFRGKPSVVRMMTGASADIYFSFGEKFNPDTLRTVPPERVLAETDCSALSIEEIIASLSAAAGRDMLPVVEENTRRVFRLD